MAASEQAKGQAQVKRRLTGYHIAHLRPERTRGGWKVSKSLKSKAGKPPRTRRRHLASFLFLSHLSSGVPPFSQDGGVSLVQLFKTLRGGTGRSLILLSDRLHSCPCSPDHVQDADAAVPHTSRYFHSDTASYRSRKKDLQ